MNLLQQRIASGAITLIAIWVCYISYTQQPADAFLFPRLVATAFVFFALITFAKALMGKSKVGEGFSLEAAKNIAPGLVVTLIYVFWAAKTLGFYTATTIAFFVLLSLYDPAPHSKVESWLKRIAITACFIIVMYLLFAKLLFVFTPRGMFM